MTVATSGDHGKPRPALIVQADAYAQHPSITILPLTSELQDAPLLRVAVEPGVGTGLRLRSQVMVDKATTIPRAKAGRRIGLPHTHIGTFSRSLRDEAHARRWVVISIRNDWRRVFSFDEQIIVAG